MHDGFAEYTVYHNSTTHIYTLPLAKYYTNFNLPEASEVETALQLHSVPWKQSDPLYIKKFYICANSNKNSRYQFQWFSFLLSVLSGVCQFQHLSLGVAAESAQS